MKYYHVTTLENWEKIRRFGLIPRIGNKTQLYRYLSEGRIYFFNSIEEAEDGLVNWIVDRYPEAEDSEEPFFSILEVKIPNDVEIFEDPELPLSAVYVIEKIPPFNIRFLMSD